MNLPNKLSLLRVALIPVMVALMLPQTLVCDLLAAAVFAAAALTDYFDGHIARSRHLITDFGKFIDPVADKLLNLSAMMMLVQRGTLPGWVVVLILARELAVDGLRMVAVGQGRVIAAGKLGKIKTASQMVMLLFVLITHQPALTAPRGTWSTRLSSARRGCGGSAPR
ncbi:MAG: CDP-diacylglycerol--glycerol-3-phosphate 3-phosphatidyltransferase [Christensenellales bacterium]